MDRALTALYAEEMIRLSDAAALAELTACELRRREGTSPPTPLRARRGELSGRIALQWTAR
jgi:hypothetical protein